MKATYSHKVSDFSTIENAIKIQNSPTVFLLLTTFFFSRYARDYAFSSKLQHVQRISFEKIWSFSLNILD